MTIKKIGILTSGGDAPGMNAAIRAVVRTALYHDVQPIGIYNGYQGMVEDKMQVLGTHDVSNIIQRGGTILKTARCVEFLSAAGRSRAARHLADRNINAVVMIGGDGSYRGAQALAQEHGIAVIGIPGTIDNDIPGTSYTLGFDTAVNTAISAIDKIRDTADAHSRIFVVEVMGRHSGQIAMHSGISCGAEDILVPETPTDIEALIQNINYDTRRKKVMRIIIVAERDDFGGGEKVAAQVAAYFPHLDVRQTVLGHIQRGGSPSHYDRFMASNMGYQAVLALLEGTRDKMMALQGGKVLLADFPTEGQAHNDCSAALAKMAEVLSS